MTVTCHSTEIEDPQHFPYRLVLDRRLKELLRRQPVLPVALLQDGSVPMGLRLFGVAR